jgi:hypothetical protein
MFRLREIEKRLRDLKETGQEKENKTVVVVESYLSSRGDDPFRESSPGSDSVNTNSLIRQYRVKEYLSPYTEPLKMGSVSSVL